MCSPKAKSPFKPVLQEGSARHHVEGLPELPASEPQQARICDSEPSPQRALCDEVRVSEARPLGLSEAQASRSGAPSVGGGIPALSHSQATRPNAGESGCLVSERGRLSMSPVRGSSVHGGMRPMSNRGYPISPGGTEILPPPLPPTTPPRQRGLAATAAAIGAKQSPGGSKSPKQRVGEGLEWLKSVLGLSGSSNEVSERAEDVRVSVSELPKLEIKEHERDLAPLLSGDWLAMITPAMKDISSTSGIWWSQVVEAATSYYQQWLMCDPVARLSLQPPQPYRFEHTKYARVEQRALTMLLRAVPTVIKEELVANRKLSSIELIALIHTTYQPGGLKERAALLRYLTNPDGCTEPVAALRSIKRWSRWKHRAAELHISTPDPTLLLGGVDAMVSKAFALYPESQFRISSYRFAKSVDHQPTEAKVVELVRFVQGELERFVWYRLLRVRLRLRSTRRVRC